MAMKYRILLISIWFLWPILKIYGFYIIYLFFFYVKWRYAARNEGSVHDFGNE